MHADFTKNREQQRDSEKALGQYSLEIQHLETRATAHKECGIIDQFVEAFPLEFEDLRSAAIDFLTQMALPPAIESLAARTVNRFHCMITAITPSLNASMRPLVIFGES